jgi:hypothetical protein
MLQQSARGDGDKGHGHAEESGQEQQLRQVVRLLDGSHPGQREQPFGVVQHQHRPPKFPAAHEPPQIARELGGGR